MGVIHFSFCRTRSRARLIAVRNLSQDDFPLQNFGPALRLWNYKLKVIDMQIAITPRNNHHAKRVSRLFIYRGAGSVRATFSFPDPRNSISCIRSLIIFAEITQRMLRAFQFITLYCVDPGIFFLKRGIYFSKEICKEFSRHTFFDSEYADCSHFEIRMTLELLIFATACWRKTGAKRSGTRVEFA